MILLRIFIKIYIQLNTINENDTRRAQLVNLITGHAGRVFFPCAGEVFMTNTHERKLVAQSPVVKG